MGNDYRRFKCPTDGKIFKVSSGGVGGGPYLKQYDGNQFNVLDELSEYPNHTRSPQLHETWNEEAEEFAGFYSECEPGEFETLTLKSI